MTQKKIQNNLNLFYILALTVLKSLNEKEK